MRGRRGRGFDPLSWLLGLGTALLFGSRTARMVALVPFLLLFIAWAHARVWWYGLGPAQRLLFWVAVACVVGAYVWWRVRGPGRLRVRRPSGGQVSVRGREGGWLPRAQIDPEWIYHFTEFRYDRTDEVAPRVLPGESVPRGVTEHLVYIGITKDAEDRYLAHLRDKGWFHDEIKFVAEAVPSRGLVEQIEQFLIGRAAMEPALSRRPRENREFNPTYDPERCRYMRAKALESRVLRGRLAEPA